jgi:hypothetical protein
MAKELGQVNNEELQMKLKKWLESGSLYTDYRYKGANGNRLPDEIQIFCHQCERETTWRNTTNRGQITVDKSTFQQRQYRCSNCKDQFIYFAYSWYDEPRIESITVPVSTFRKYGQWPALEERVSKELEKALGAHGRFEVL